MTPHSPRSIARLDSGARRIHPQGEPGRVCSTPGCTTRLSIYNASELCALHADALPLDDPDDVDAAT